MSAAPVKVRSTCRLCNSKNVIKAVPLASIPIISPNVECSDDNSAMQVMTAPLDHYLCEDCGLIQLLDVVDPSLIYRDYLYRTSISKGLTEHFGGLADAMIDRGRLSSDALVVEFGSNDGTLLSFFKMMGMRVQGVDPARDIADDATAQGIPTISDFFGVRLAHRILLEKGPAKAIISNNCMANIDDLAEIFEGIETLLDDSGIFVFETQYAFDVFEQFLLDVLYHEHISCFSVNPVANVLSKWGLEVFDAEPIPTKGGSVRFWIQKQGGPQAVSQRVTALIDKEVEYGLFDADKLGVFSTRVGRLKVELDERITAVKENGGWVAAYGVSVGCVSLIHQLGLQDKIDFLLDDTPFKDQLVGPGYVLPVFKGRELAEHAPDLVIILAWRYAEMITEKQAEYLDHGGRFIVVLPNLLEIQGDKV